MKVIKVVNDEVVYDPREISILQVQELYICSFAMAFSPPNSEAHNKKKCNVKSEPCE